MQRNYEEKEKTWVCYDAHLASAYLKNPGLFPAISEISNKIIALLQHRANRKYLEEALKATPLTGKSLFQQLIDQLYKSTMFGKLDNTPPTSLTPAKLIYNILNALKYKQDNSPLTMHIHQVFMMLIFDHLPDKVMHFFHKSNPSTLSEKIAQQLRALTDFENYNKQWAQIKADLVKKIFYNKYFPIPRIISGRDGHAAVTVSTADGSYCPDLAIVEPHCSLAGVFSPIANSDWLTEIEKYGLPFIAGPSGHSGSLLLLAALLGNFDHEQLAQYAAGAIALLCGGTLHTVHEVLVIFQIGGLTYTPGEYYKAMSNSFINSNAYQELQKRFPERLLAADEHVSTQFKKSEHVQIHQALSFPFFPAASLAALPNCSLQAIGLPFKSSNSSSNLFFNNPIVNSSCLIGTLLLSVSLFRYFRRGARAASQERFIDEKATPQESQALLIQNH